MRIRTIKPELIEDDKTANLSHLDWRTFVSLLVMADDYGNLRGNPRFVAGKALFGFDDLDLEPTLEELERLELIQRYTVNGQPYIHIVNWSKHQRVDKPSKPQIPGPPEDAGNPDEGSQNPDEGSRGSPGGQKKLAPDQGPRTKDQEKEKDAREDSSPSPSSSVPISDWKPTEADVTQLQTDLLCERQHVDTLVRRYRRHWQPRTSERRTAEDWSSAFLKWAAGEWNSKRPDVLTETKTHKQARASPKRKRQTSAQAKAAALTDQSIP